jgi:hypothetical protein
MRHNIIRILILSLVIVVVLSCSTIKKSGRIVESSIVSIPDTVRTKLTIDTSAKLEGISRKTTLFYCFTLESPNKFIEYINTSNGSLDKNASLKKAALFNALQGTKYDILVMPRYTISSTRSFIMQQTVVKVTGYGAYQTVVTQ